MDRTRSPGRSLQRLNAAIGCQRGRRVLAIHRDQPAADCRAGARIISAASRLEAPSVITSSMISTRPLTGAPTRSRLRRGPWLPCGCGVRHVAAFSPTRSRRCGQRDALVGRSEQHVELEARGDQAACIEFAEPAELGTVVEETGVEEVRRQSTSLGLEIAEAQHPGFHRELHECLRQRVSGGHVRHRRTTPGFSPGHAQPERHPLGSQQRASFGLKIGPIVWGCRRSRPRRDHAQLVTDDDFTLCARQGAAIAARIGETRDPRNR